MRAGDGHRPLVTVDGIALAGVRSACWECCDSAPPVLTLRVEGVDGQLVGPALAVEPDGSG